eukprot:357033-Chlamydomonas_euryale.AAC.6
MELSAMVCRSLRCAPPRRQSAPFHGCPLSARPLTSSTATTRNPLLPRGKPSPAQSGCSFSSPFSGATDIKHRYNWEPSSTQRKKPLCPKRIPTFLAMYLQPPQMVPAREACQ